MNESSYQCEQTCRNTCATLNRIIQLETSIVRMTEEAIQQCGDMDMKLFLTGLAETNSEAIFLVLKKLNELKARSEILDGISSSFDSPEI